MKFAKYFNVTTDYLLGLSVLPSVTPPTGDEINTKFRNPSPAAYLVAEAFDKASNKVRITVQSALSDFLPDNFEFIEGARVAETAAKNSTASSA